MSNDVKSLEQSLARLEGLQTQVRYKPHRRTVRHSTYSLTILQLDSLRSTVPTLVSPLIRPQTSKAQMFAEVKNSAVTTASQLTAFRNDWNSEQTQQIFSKAQESAQKDPDLSKAEEVARFGWAERVEKES
jgi:hypothetical protein